MPPLIASLQDDAVPDVIEAEELKRLSDSIPEISQRVPAIFQDPHDWRHRICVPKMLSRLLQLTVPLQQVSHAVSLPPLNILTMTFTYLDTSAQDPTRSSPRGYSVKGYSEQSSSKVPTLH
jgi:hypothetical protein